METKTSEGIKPTWQSFRKAILDLSKLQIGKDISENTILERFEFLKQYLDYLLEPLFEEPDILDYYLLYRIYDITGKSEQITEYGQKLHWVSIWSNFLIYRDCFFHPVYPEESFYYYEKLGEAFSSIPYPSKEVFYKRTMKLKRTFSNRLKKLNAHGLVDIQVRWSEFEEALEFFLQEKEVYLSESSIILIRCARKGYEKLKDLGYDLKIAYSNEVGKRVEFVPPEEYPDSLWDGKDLREAVALNHPPVFIL